MQLDVKNVSVKSIFKRGLCDRRAFFILSYPKHLIQQDVLEEVGQTPEDLEKLTPETATYQILVPVANPNTQKIFLQLALAIAGTKLQPSVVHPLQLIELNDDYLFRSTPLEADRLIPSGVEVS